MKIMSLNEPTPSRRIRRSLTERPLLLVLLALALFLSMKVTAAPLDSSAFTYQGRLTAGGVPANGLFDLRYILFNASTGGFPVGPTLTNENVAVSNGLFTTTLDFGPGIFNGAAYWLEVAVRPANEQLNFGLPLLPRQPIIAAPYALYAPNAGTASNALTAVTAATATTALSVNSVTWNAVTDKPPGFADNLDNDTSYTAGLGLQLSANEFRVNFAGSGLLTSAARSDHTHTAADITAGVLASPRLVGTYDAALHFSNPANIFAGNGANLTALDGSQITSGLLSEQRLEPAITRDSEVMGLVLQGDGPDSGLNADQLDGLHARAFWQLGGNSNSIPGQDFLGTTDTNALEFRVNGARALRLEPAPNGPNLLAGVSANAISNGVAGSSITGGTNNIVEANYAVIAGGRNNRVDPSATYAMISGGLGARASRLGQWVQANGSFGSLPGDAQSSTYVLRGTSTNAAPVELFLDGAGARLSLPPNAIWTFEVLVVSAALNGQAAGFGFQGVIKRNGAATALVGTVTSTHLARDNGLWTAEIVADDVTEALVIRVTGAAAQTVRWVATVRTAELIF